MAYEVTANRRRPKGFEELAGQDFVSATLKASIESGRIAHAYLFSGPRGCGKTSMARILARALNCERGPTATPCGACDNCKAIKAGSSLDVIEIDGASNTSVDNVRQIKDEVLFPPNAGKYKIYIIDEVHMLSNSAFNALLKTIEEPPPYIIFIFATTELHKVPATIKSRCQQFNFRLLPLGTIKRLLSEAAAELGVQADDDALFWIAKEATGSARDAYTLFDQVVSFSDGHLTAAAIRDKLGLVGVERLNAVFEACVSADRSAALAALDELLARGVSIEQCISDSVEYCRALLLIKNGVSSESLIGDDPGRYSKPVLEALDTQKIERAMAGLFDLHRDIRYSVNPRFELELGVLRLCSLKDWIAPAELARAVDGLRAAAAAGRLAPSPVQKAANAPAEPAGDKGEGEKKKPEGLSAPPVGPQAEAEADEEAEGMFADDADLGAIVEDPGRLRELVIASIRNSNIILANSLTKSLRWEMADGRLVVVFGNDYEASLARQDLDVVTKKVCDLGGRALRIEFKVEAPHEPQPAREGPGGDKPEPAREDPVTIVERVFRGRRVPMKPAKENQA